MRRTLPPMGDLSCFEAVVRNRSVTRAAEELNLTQSAVSRRIANLEKLLGVQFFVRDKQRMIPTAAAELYAHDLRKLLGGIEISTTRALSQQRKGGELTIASPATFGSRWLVPRLNDFIASYPEININLVAKNRPFDFKSETIHAAIHFGLPTWSGAVTRFLMVEDVLPFASPRLLETGLGRDPNDIARMTLIQHTTRPDLWREWLRHADVLSSTGGDGPKFELYSLAIEAAIAGIGVVLIPEMLVKQELEMGLLKRASSITMRCSEAYYYVFPREMENNKNVIRFGEWLSSKIPSTDLRF